MTVLRKVVLIIVMGVWSNLSIRSWEDPMRYRSYSMSTVTKWCDCKMDLILVLSTSYNPLPSIRAKGKVSQCAAKSIELTVTEVAAKLHEIYSASGRCSARALVLILIDCERRVAGAGRCRRRTIDTQQNQYRRATVWIQSAILVKKYSSSLRLNSDSLKLLLKFLTHLLEHAPGKHRHTSLRTSNSECFAESWKKLAFSGNCKIEKKTRSTLPISNSFLENRFVCVSSALLAQVKIP